MHLKLRKNKYREMSRLLFYIFAAGSMLKAKKLYSLKPALCTMRALAIW